MNIPQIPFTATDWAEVREDEHKGSTGTSRWRTVEAGGIRLRIVDYSPGYLSDHWCPKGHVFYVLEGEFGIKLKDGTDIVLGAGMSFIAGDDDANPHRGYSEKGARAFIVD
jgi:quercetin dioxygenase-like cupin family protein